MTHPPLDTAIPFVGVFAEAADAARASIRPIVGGRVTERAIEDLHRDLIGRMSHLVAPALLSLYESSAQGYQAFVADFARQGALERNLPVAARLVTTMAEQFIDTTTELAARIEHDLPSLRQALGTADGKAGGIEIERIGNYKGDPHRNGRSVTKLGTSSGAVFYYKPRSLDAEAGFRRCLAWLARRFDEPAELPAVLTCDGYGWMGEIRQAPVRSASHYWRSAGRMAALAHLLGVTDLHSGNVIAGATGPIPVDLECMNHPLVWSSTPVTDPDDAPDITELVMSTGLLPNYYDEDLPVALELCGLLARPNQSGGAWYSTWRGLGTDNIGTTRRLSNWTGKDHLPVDAAGGFVPADVDAVVRGFAEAMDALSGPDSPVTEAGDVESRVLLRKTNEYTSRFEAAATVEALSDEADFERVVTGLADWTRPFMDQLGSHRARIDASERRAMLRLDVPLHTAVGSTLVLDDGTRLDDVVLESGAARLEKRLHRARGAAASAQSQIVLLVLEEYTDRTPVKPELVGAPRTVSSAELLEAAVAVADRLVAANIGSLEHPAWVSSTGRHPRMTARIGVDDLYAGAAGVGFALGVVAALVPERSDLRTLADRALRRPLPADVPWFDVGTSGQAYAAALLGAVIDDGSLVDHAVRLVSELEPTIAPGAELDLMNGWAGVLAAATTVASVSGDPVARDRVAALANALGTELDAQLGSDVRRPLRLRPSVAHGGSGIALAFDRAAAVLGDEQLAGRAMTLRAAALDVLRAGRDASAETESSALATWCWGELGVVHEWACAESTATDIPVEFPRSLLHECAAEPHTLCHLCCGGAGAAHVLGAAARRLEDPVGLARADELLAALVDRVAAGGALPSLRRSRFEDPGLFAGTAGVAYALACAARPDVVPDVLRFPVAPIPAL